MFQFGPWLVQVYDVQHSGDFELRMTDAQRTGPSVSRERSTPTAISCCTRRRRSRSTMHSRADSVPTPAIVSSSTRTSTAARPELIRARTVKSRTTAGTACRGASGGPARRGRRFGKIADLATDLEVVDPLSPPVTSTPDPTTTTTAPAKSPVGVGKLRSDPAWLGSRPKRLREGNHRRRRPGRESRERMSGPTPANASDSPTHATDSCSATIQAVRCWRGTDDGGAHWRSVKTPSPASTTSRSRGVVYVVELDPTDLRFRIWSAPVDTLTWTAGSLAIRLAARAGSRPRNSWSRERAAGSS